MVILMIKIMLIPKRVNTTSKNKPILQILVKVTIKLMSLMAMMKKIQKVVLVLNKNPWMEMELSNLKVLP